MMSDNGYDSHDKAVTMQNTLKRLWSANCCCIAGHSRFTALYIVTVCCHEKYLLPSSDEACCRGVTAGLFMNTTRVITAATNAG